VSDAAEIEAVFGAVPLFRRLSRQQRSRLAKRATRRAYGPGAVIVRQGDTSMSLYIVLAGAIRVQRELAGGAAMPVAEGGRAFFFGEMGLIDDEPRAATVVAVAPTECALLARWDFQTELRHDPDIALALLPILTGRIRELEARLAPEPPDAARPPAGQARSQGSAVVMRGRAASAAASPTST
jgi:CRP/FNR family transcriptional regulator, cyclic AMP receptor protein